MGITSLFKLLYLLFGRCGLFTAFSLYDFTQLAAVGSNQILFQRAGFEFHHNIVVIGRNQTVTSFKQTIASMILWREPFLCAIAVRRTSRV